MTQPRAETTTPLWERLILPLWIAAIAAWRVAGDDQADALWMAREGASVLKGQPWIHADSWSWDPVASDFIPTSPGWQVLLAHAQSLSGRQGIAALTFVSICLSLAAVAWASRVLGASRAVTALAVIGCSTLAMGLLSSRAALPALALFLAVLTAFWRSRGVLARTQTALATVATATMGVVAGAAGIWLHSSWTAYSLAAALGIWIMLRNRAFGAAWHRLAIGVAATTGLLLGTLTGPTGLDAWSNAGRVSSACSGLLLEWKHPWDLGTFWVVAWAALLLYAIVLTARCIRNTSTTHPLQLALMPAFLGLTLAGGYAARFVLLGALAGAPLMAAPGSRASRRLLFGLLRRTLGSRSYEVYWRPVVAMLGALALAAAALQLPDIRYSVDRAVAAIPTGCQTFTSQGSGKAVTGSRFDVTVWMDGRQDYWGRERILQSNAYLSGVGQPTLLPAGTQCVLLESGQFPRLSQALQESGDWQLSVQATGFTLWLPRS